MLLSGRPRRAPWVKETQNKENYSLYHAKSGRETELELDPTSALIWQNCDGEHSGQALMNLFSSAYPEAPDVKEDVNGILGTLLDGDFLVVDGSDAALEFQGGIIRNIVPNLELQWQLERVRQFLFGILRIDEAESIDADIEALLNNQALQNAKTHDADSALSLSDGSSINYGGAMRSPSFAKAVNGIISELNLAMPDVTAEMELSGNAIYLKGAHMGWHSNHSRSDGRIYCSWTQHPNTNFFRYEHPLTGEIITEWEQPGWNIKSFTIPPKPSRFWHCIGASSLRLAIGFRYELEPTSEAN